MTRLASQLAPTLYSDSTQRFFRLITGVNNLKRLQTLTTLSNSSRNSNFSRFHSKFTNFYGKNKYSSSYFVSGLETDTMSVHVGLQMVNQHTTRNFADQQTVLNPFDGMAHRLSKVNVVMIKDQFKTVKQSIS